MHMVDYWKEKTEILSINKEVFKEWSEQEEIVVRKMIIIQVMNIPVNGLCFYLKRDEWLRIFALNNVEQLDNASLVKEKFLEKRDDVIESFFYKKDREELSSFFVCHTSDQNTKNDVCNIIKEILKPEVYDVLSKKQREKVGLYEKIYFEPIELINGYVEEMSGSEVYYTVLMEQWKTANEMAANISSQRTNMNNFYVSLMSILIGGILFGDQLLGANVFVKRLFFGLVAVIGVIFCIKWISQIDNYGKLNAAKYDIINELERQLPANVMLCEWLRTEENVRKKRRKINFSKQEKSSAWFFLIVIIIVPIIMFVGTWWN